ncbi:hypothetical protein BX070DRAFT_37836 [Coemansia spiralis]|nr:hypothetical protein BX070DRAFT_37836 [Coemansia spiralis]
MLACLIRLTAGPFLLPSFVSIAYDVPPLRPQSSWRRETKNVAPNFPLLYPTNRYLLFSHLSKQTAALISCLFLYPSQMQKVMQLFEFFILVLLQVIPSQFHQPNISCTICRSCDLSIMLLFSKQYSLSSLYLRRYVCKVPLALFLDTHAVYF